MKRKFYNILLLKKRLKKNNSINQISLLNKEKLKIEKATKLLNEILVNSKFNSGELLSSGEVQSKSKFHSEIHKRIEVSNNRSVFLKKEIKQNLTKLNQINKQTEVISEKIKKNHKELLKINEEKLEIVNRNNQDT